MKKYPILILLLCLHVMARGQTPSYQWLYWYDDNSKNLQSTSITGSDWQRQIDAGQLSEGIHTVNMMVTDEKGRLSAPKVRPFIKIDQSGNGEELCCLCSVDGEIYARYQMPAVGDSEHWLLDMNDVSVGIHRIQVQAIDISGLGSSVYNGFFLRCGTEEEMKQMSCLCYVDDSLYAKETIVDGSGQLHLNINMSNLNMGLHRIRLHALDALGAASSAYNGFFLRCDTEEEMRQMSCLCFVDDSLYAKDIVPTSEGFLQWELDMNSISTGLHRVQVQTITPSGKASAINNSFFLRMPTKEETDNLRCMYILDNDTICHEASTLPYDGVYQFNLDMSNLNDGLHRISYFLGNELGLSTHLQTRFFIKTPAGGNAITEYVYWLNDSIRQAEQIKITPPQNPLRLVSLLPVPAHPICSSRFHFEVTDGKPMMYAKNTLHVRFFDTNGRFSDASEQYVDYNVSREVKAEILKPTQTFSKVRENDVRWYMMQAEPGETIDFRLSQTATLQMFSTIDEEIFKVSGTASTDWNSILIQAAGIYFIAVHDVTDSQSSLTLECMRNSNDDWEDTIKMPQADTATDRNPTIYDLLGRKLFSPQKNQIYIIGDRKIMR